MTFVGVFFALLVSLWLDATSLSAAAPSSTSSTDQAAKVAVPEAAGSLHERLDRLFEEDSLVPATRPADEAEFLRRAMLDLWGIIPTAAEARTFLDDQSPDKRTVLIDRLLASPRFARHMATTFDVMWVERQIDKNISFNAWYDFLYQSFLANKPYDKLVREVLAADEASRPTTRFYHARLCQPDTLTRDIGRIFFGMDMQCNQCHDHPVIDDYKITDYYGLRAFVARTYVFNNRNNKLMQIGEKPDGETSYVSVFTGESADKVLPRLPRGEVLPAEPSFKKGDELVAKPAKGEMPIPKFSRRALLAEQATSGSYALLHRNAVNRLWAQLFGRGLVHPVDFIHPDNPPSHPAVLDELERDFREHGCDIKRTLRELMLTSVYGRTCDLPKPDELDPAAVTKRLQDCEHQLVELKAQLTAAEAESLAAYEAFSKLKAARKKDEKSVPTDEFAAASAARESALIAMRQMQTLSSAKAKSVDEARLANECLKLAKSDPDGAALQWTALVDFWTERGDVPRLRSLPPEVFTDSILQAAGIVATAEAKVRAKIKAAPPKEMRQAAEEERSSIEAVLVDKQTFEPLRTNFTQFVTLYAEAPGQDFSATLNQALFFGNGGLVEGWLKPEESNLVARLDSLSDPTELANELYLSILTRRASDVEREEVTGYLTSRAGDRVVAIQEMVWGLMSCSEFRFNH